MVGSKETRFTTLHNVVPSLDVRSTIQMLQDIVMLILTLTIEELPLPQDFLILITSHVAPY